MSLNPRDLTQGGQIAFMRLKMFLQINNLISYYVIMGTVLFTIALLFMRISIQTMMNGIIYWFVRALSPFTSKMNIEPVYTIRYYDLQLEYSASKILEDPYTTWCGQILRQELIISGGAALLVAFIATFAAYWYLGRAGRKQSEDEIIGGRVLAGSVKEVARMLKKRGEASDIRIDGLPLKLDSEIQNFAMHGTVGSGKSQLMRKILRYLRERGDLVIIYDKGCSFIEDFYDETRDKVLNPMDARCANWDLWEECRTISELENTSSTLIPAAAGEDPFWQGSARTIFSEGAERMRTDSDRSYNKLLRTLLAIQLDQLRSYLTGTPASTLVDGKIEKTAISIRSVLTNYVKALRYMQGIDRPGREKFTIRDWMKGQTDKSRNGWLFVTSDEQYQESLKPLISMWLSIAATSLLAMGENRQRRVWFFYDELPSLHKLATLPRIIAEARKFGGCFALGFQNYAQVEEIYGPKAAAGLYDLLNTKFFFRSPSAEIAQFVEKDVGETRRKAFSEQTSFGHEQVRDGISIGKDEERVSIITYTDVQTLNDLECFVTLPGSYPVVKLSMRYTGMPAVAEGLILRDVQTSLDAHIEDELNRRSDDERRSLDTLFTPPSPPEDTAQDTATAANAANPTGTEKTAGVSSAEPARKPTAPPDAAGNADARQPDTAKPGAAVPASSAPAGVAGGGGGGTEKALDEDLQQATPPGVDADGEMTDPDAYQTWMQEQEKVRDLTRRDEININSPVQHEPGGREY